MSSGFEPLKDGFADRSLRPLGYDTIAEVSIADSIFLIKAIPANVDHGLALVSKTLIRHSSFLKLLICCRGTGHHKTRPGDRGYHASDTNPPMQAKPSQYFLYHFNQSDTTGTVFHVILLGMKKIILTAILALCCLGGAFAVIETDMTVIPPTYSYVSLGTGYVAGLSNQPYRQAVPVSMQAGVLSNNDSGTMGLGFGTRLDLGFDVGGDDGQLSFDILTGMDSIFRLNRVLSLDVIFGLATGIVDDDRGGSIVTLGPGISAALRITPPGFTGIAFDIGAAAYGQFGVGEDYIGVDIVPFVGITFNVSSWPWFYHPLYLAETLIW